MLDIRFKGSPVLRALATMMMGLTAASLAHASEARSIDFKRSVVNLESFSGLLGHDPPSSVRRAPPADPQIWFGEIFRQLPADPPTSREHNVPFAILLEGGVATHAWVDANLNGDVTDDPAPPLSAYPDDPASRSFLTTLRWSAKTAQGSIPIERLVRVVIETPPTEDQAPDYRVQDVYGMLGG